MSRTAAIQEAPIQKLLATMNLPENVISLGQGAPYFPPPPEVLEAAENTIRDRKGYTYSEDAGWPELREAISEKLAVENGIHAGRENIIVTNGGNQAFVNVLLAITDIGDEVVLVSPYYFNHHMAVELAGCRPVTIGTDDDYQPLVEELKEALTPRTRAVVTVSPNNPTGAVYKENLLKAVNEICADAGIYHISDEAYEHFVFDGAKHVSPGSYDPATEHTISLFSFSKSYGMPGYRVGYSVHPADLHREVLKVQDTVSICPSGVAQSAALAALGVGKAYLEDKLAVLSNVRRVFKEELSDINGCSVPMTKGSYYFFLRLNTSRSSVDIAIELAERYGVITIPGDIFGTSYPALRVSYGNIDMEGAREGMSRLKQGLEELIQKG